MKKRCLRGGAWLLAVLLVCCPLRAGALTAEDIPAPSAILLDAETGTVLFEKEAHVPRPCASLTKIMTLLLVMEAMDAGRIAPEDTVTASAHAASMGGSDIWLEAGECMTVDELLRAVVTVSANDAAVALAEHVCGSEADFVEAMNRRAAELGMTETRFLNCTGLDAEGHVSTARDVAWMSRELLRHEAIFRYTTTWIDHLRDGKTQLVNTNKLIRSYAGITGLKTGTTSQAGSCMAASALRDGLPLVAVVLGAASANERFSAAAMLLDHGFANYRRVIPALPPLADLPVPGGMEPQVPLTASAPPPFLLEKGSGEVEARWIAGESLAAPIRKGDIVGAVEYSLQGRVLGQQPVYAARDVEAVGFWAVLRLLWGSVCRL